MARWTIRIAALAALAIIAACAVIRVMPDDPTRWHVDARNVERTGKPNDVTAGPPGAGTDLTVLVYAEPPRELLGRIDAAALATPRTEALARDPDGLGATYVTRSRIFGFPDYTSIRAVEAGEGASLHIWGRARYGHSDFGVNRERVEGWIGALGQGAE